MLKYVSKMFFLFPIVILGVLVYGCMDEPASTEKLEGRIGKEFVQTLQSPMSVSAFKVLPKHHLTKQEKQGYNVYPRERMLSKDQIKSLQKIVLNDEHYYFDKTKKCMFIPEFAARVEGKKDYFVFASFSAKQLKFVDGDNEMIIDCDPMGSYLESEMTKYIR